MKYRLTVLFFIIALFSFSSAKAQMGQRRQQRNYDAPKSNEKKNYDFAQASTDHLTKVLKLDGFQSAAVKTFMDEFKKDVESMAKVEMPIEAQTEKYNILNQKLETKVLGVLNEEQKVLYEQEKNKKDKKKKKGKDKKEDEAEEQK